MYEEKIKKAETLVEALPYLKEFSGKTVVIKYGGSLMVNEDLKTIFANDIVLLASTNGGDEIIADGVSLTVAGPTFASRSDMTLIARTGETLGGSILLEEGTDGGDAEDAITLNGTDGDSANADSSLDLEDKTSGIATYSQAGSTSGTAYVLNGVTVAAA